MDDIQLLKKLLKKQAGFETEPKRKKAFEDATDTVDEIQKGED